MAALKNVVSAEKKIATAAAFRKALQLLQSDAELKKISRYFKTGHGEYGEGDQFLGVKMGSLFALAKTCINMPATEMEKMLESPIHEMRAGAVSIMDKASRAKNVTPSRLKELFDLYMRRHDRINSWDLVDLGCLYMTGRYLADKPRKRLYKMARSKNLWERRTAIVSTCYFIKQGETADAFAIASLLLNDKEDMVHKGTGWMLRFAGDKNPRALKSFLDLHAADMPRTLLRNCIEHFSKNEKEYYMNMGKNK